jgi:hypothetical protein
MLISHPKKFIFIHIYKNAGTSIHNALLPYAYPKLYKWPNRIFKRLGIHRFDPVPCASHATALSIRSSIGSRLFDSYYKFAVVRNPWDWQLSLYTYAIKDRYHHHHKLTVKLGSFDDYLKWRLNEDLHTQSSFVCNELGKVIVDRILRFETIEEDFSLLCKHLGINTQLSHDNPSKLPGYREYYSESGRKLIAAAFQEDIDRFGYEF